MAVQAVVATFTAEEGPKTVTWTTGTHAVLPGNPTVTSGSPPGSVWIDTVTATGALVYASAAFTGTVTLLVLDV